MAVASFVGCSWCLDFNYFMAHNQGLDVDKAREIPRWRESDVFTPLEREVMEYAEAMTQTPPTVTDELVARAAGAARRGGAGRADERRSAFANLTTRAQRRARHRVGGLRRVLRARAAGGHASPASSPGMSRRPVRRPPQPALHRRLRDARLGRRRRGRRAGDVAAVGAASTRREVRDPRAYLVRIVTRQALNRLRTMSRRREDYVGEWLPEPLLTSPDVAEDVELAESVSIAMLTVLETLGPTERAVFVLREVFDTPYDEIAEAVGKSPAAVRQIAHRAREHVAARRPRMAVDRAEQQQVVERFLAAVRNGRPAGPARRARARRRAHRRRRRRGRRGAAPDRGRRSGGDAAGPARAVRTRRADRDAVWLNGAPAARIDPDGELNTAVSLAIEDGRITRIYAVRNPHKLSRLDAEVVLRR